MSIDDFSLGHFYKRDDIRKKLQLSNMGGIRVGRKQNIIVLFWNPKEEKTLKKYDDTKNASNIYHDYYDQQTGLYNYTGAGQSGDQELSRVNKSLAESKENNIPVYLFRQYIPKENLEFLGQVELTTIKKSRQPDENDIMRNVFIFELKPIGKSLPHSDFSETEALSRQLEEPLQKARGELDEIEKPDKKTIEKNIKKLNDEIEKQEKKEVNIPRNKTGFERFKKMVTEIKNLYDQCMICKTKHFEKEDGSIYSEVAHIVPFHIDQDDRSNNLMSLCPTCHKKFDYAKRTEKIKMYEQLCKNHPEINFRHPLFFEE